MRWIPKEAIFSAGKIHFRGVRKVRVEGARMRRLTKRVMCREQRRHAEVDTGNAKVTLFQPSGNNPATGESAQVSIDQLLFRSQSIDVLY